jgi:hypothetical protein
VPTLGSTSRAAHQPRRQARGKHLSQATANDGAKCGSSSSDSPVSSPVATTDDPVVRICKQEVAGSIPAGSTREVAGQAAVFRVLRLAHSRIGAGMEALWKPPPRPQRSITTLPSVAFTAPSNRRPAVRTRPAAAASRRDRAQNAHVHFRVDRRAPGTTYRRCPQARGRRTRSASRPPPRRSHGAGRWLRNRAVHTHAGPGASDRGRVGRRVDAHPGHRYVAVAMAELPYRAQPRIRAGRPRHGRGEAVSISATIARCLP